MKTVIAILLKFVFTFTFIFFFYGLFKYPDTPIRQCYENQYCGKYGKFYSLEDYENSKRWETVNMISFPLTFLLLFINNRNKSNGLNNEF